MKYKIDIYCGKVYCGNGYYDTLDECYAFALSDGFCDKAKIYDMNSKNVFTVKIDREGR